MIAKNDKYIYIKSHVRTAKNFHKILNINIKIISKRDNIKTYNVDFATKKDEKEKEKEKKRCLHYLVEKCLSVSAFSITRCISLGRHLVGSNRSL